MIKEIMLVIIYSMPNGAIIQQSTYGETFSTIRGCEMKAYQLERRFQASNKNIQFKYICAPKY